MRTLIPLVLSIGLFGCPEAPVPVAPVAPELELNEARALFEKNIAAIQEKNREDYLDCYRPDERLVRAGNEGVKLGFKELAEGTSPTGSDEWPEKLVATDVEVHWIAPGLVYGAYRYAVTIKGETTTGLSERVMRKMDGRWRVVVTTAFQDPAKVSAKVEAEVEGEVEAKAPSAPAPEVRGDWDKVGPKVMSRLKLCKGACGKIWIRAGEKRVRKAWELKSPSLMTCLSRCR